MSTTRTHSQIGEIDFDSNNDFNVDNIWNIQDIIEKLGDHVTVEQSANIVNGSFNGLLIGAYWTIDGTNYRIMAHDQFYGYNGIDKHHVVVMPDTIYSMQRYNDTDTNSGGYNSSVLKGYIENIYNPYIISKFGDTHILAHTHDLTSGNYFSGILTPTDNTKAWLINSYNLDGSKYSLETDYSWQDADKVQFPAFKYNTNLKITNHNGSASYWWLGSSRSYRSEYFCFVFSSGIVSYTYPSDSLGVRPAFLVY